MSHEEIATLYHAARTGEFWKIQLSILCGADVPLPILNHALNKLGRTKITRGRFHDGLCEVAIQLEREYCRQYHGK